MKPYAPIDCADYEYIELACMDRYEVDVVKDDGTIRGLAINTEANNTGEYLIVQIDNNAHESVRVDLIKQIIVLSENRRFDERIFESHVLSSRSGFHST
jgi:Rho-binding antiterminator